MGIEKQDEADLQLVENSSYRCVVLAVTVIEPYVRNLLWCSLQDSA